MMGVPEARSEARAEAGRDAATDLVSGPAARRWEPVCGVDDLIPDRGVAALVGGVQVAVFRLASGEVLAVDDLDPFSGACLLSRGLVGDLAGEPTVASPVYKQRFLLRSGRCVDDDGVAVRTWAARVVDGGVEVAPS